MSRHISIRITADDWISLRQSLFTEDGNENAAVLLCGMSELGTEVRLLVRRILAVPQWAYVDRQYYHLEIAPRFYNLVVDHCLSEHLNPIIVHSHPEAEEARYSPSDNFGESRLLPVLEALIPGATVGSMVLTPNVAAGRQFSKSKFQPLDSLTITGQRSQIFLFTGPKSMRKDLLPQFDRQIRAFGAEGQKLVEHLKIGIVGVGGTGSIIAEQLVRIGIKDFILIDSDRIEESNVTRLFGSSSAHVGLHKVKIVAKHLTKLGAKKIRPVSDTAIRQSVLMVLRDRDVLFACVDNDRSRSILSRFSYQYLIPLIDVGIRLDGRSGDIKAAAGRVTVVGNGMVCLRCSHHVNADRILAESLPEDERKRLEREGYVMGIDEPAPAVVSLNTTVAGMAVTAALNLFVNLTGGLQPLSQLYDATTGTVFTAREVHTPACDICDSEQGVKALGDAQIVSAYE